MARSTLDIAIAVKEAEESITDEELRLCIAAMSGIEHFYRSALIDLIELIREGQPESMLKMKAHCRRNQLVDHPGHESR